VFKEGFIGHTDSAVTPVPDTRPPNPNPPVWFRKPQAFYKISPPYGEGKIETYTTFVLGDEYSEDDYVIDENEPYEVETDPPYGDDTTLYYHLYRAKKNLTYEDTIKSPSLDSENWEWIPFTIELCSAMASCECIDDATISNPVKYRFVGKDDAPDTDYSEGRIAEITLEEHDFADLFGVIDIDDTEVTSLEENTTARIHCAGASALSVGVTVRIRGKVSIISGDYEVEAVGTDDMGNYFEIDIGYEIPAAYPLDLSGAVAVYAKDVAWRENEFKDCEWAIRRGIRPARHITRRG
jgi:hypothetical protein